MPIYKIDDPKGCFLKAASSATEALGFHLDDRGWVAKDHWTTAAHNSYRIRDLGDRDHAQAIAGGKLLQVSILDEKDAAELPRFNAA